MVGDGDFRDVWRRVHKENEEIDDLTVCLSAQNNDKDMFELLYEHYEDNHGEVLQECLSTAAHYGHKDLFNFILEKYYDEDDVPELLEDAMEKRDERLVDLLMNR